MRTLNLQHNKHTHAHKYTHTHTHINTNTFTHRASDTNIKPQVQSDGLVFQILFWDS